MVHDNARGDLHVYRVSTLVEGYVRGTLSGRQLR
jgi:hypothetical protein